ncbi:protein of unknown function [Nocardia amikacinitolerans]|uniref:DUF4396 domain-containing protein n=1 Tax=Nocardia amikacinitolerans TaxID=756689 RepID=A0A285LUF3_9NOCA|nr:DUF4396 domain-containing protein [Nocardia amikacinitolerans]SNY88093.1 protein of unknown function [Nocardia amikacinitolerans]
MERRHGAQHGHSGHAGHSAPAASETHAADQHAGHRTDSADTHHGHGVDAHRSPSAAAHQTVSTTDHSAHTGHHPAATWKMAATATLHCLTGCAIGEVLGLVIGTALGWSTLPTMVLAIVLAFGFGYALTIRGVMKAGVAFGAALSVAFAADTLSITVMEITDNAVLLAVPGAMHAGLTDALFWGALAFAFAVAFVVTTPVNKWLIGRGKGHAVVHAYHGGH